MAARNPDSVGNAQGEFTPHKPRSEPSQSSGHQIGQKVSPADHAPEFSAQTLPAGSAPASRTFQPDSTGEVPGPAFDDSTQEGAGALDFPGATSADVHTGLGHPGQGQTSREQRQASKGTSAGAGLAGRAHGGLGLQGEEPSTEFKRLQQDDHAQGPVPGHNVDRPGAEDRLPARSEDVAAERGQ